MQLANRLTMLRQIKKVSQKEFALYLRLSAGTISNYERGVHQPDLETLCRLADYYGVTTDYLLGQTSHSAPLPPPCSHDACTELRERIYLESADLSLDHLRALRCFLKMLKHDKIRCDTKDKC